VKSAGEIMEILEAFDLTGSLRDAGELAGCSHHTVARYVAAREAGGGSDRPAARPRLIEEFLPKVEEWVDNSKGKIRADRAHEKLLALGFTGSERTTRRAVAGVKKAYRAGNTRVHRPWVTEPGMWLQYDFGDGPRVDGAATTLFCAWLAWSRFRVVLALRDKTVPSVFAALDVTLRPVDAGDDLAGLDEVGEPFEVAGALLGDEHGQPADARTGTAPGPAADGPCPPSGCRLPPRRR
jgi:hypothetical protein